MAESRFCSDRRSRLPWSIDLLKKTQAVVKERNTLMHIHVQQGDRETYQIVKRYGKETCRADERHRAFR